MDKIVETYNQIHRQIYGFNLIKEERHLVPKIEEYYNIILANTQNKLKDGNNHFVIGDDAFIGMDNFFNHIAICIDALIDNRLMYTKQDSLTNTNKESLVDGKLDVLVIKINIKTTTIHYPYILASAFYHEFHHAYEDWKRKFMTKNHDGLSLYFQLSNYHNINLITSTLGEYGEALGEILYLLSKIEQRAYMQGTIGEFQEIIKLNPSIAQIPFREAIKLAPSANRYINLQKNYDVLNNVKDKELQKEILNLFNTNSGIIKHLNQHEVNQFNRLNSDFLKEFQKYKIKTYSGLMKFLKYKIDYTTEKIIYNLSKIFGENTVNEMFVSRNIIETNTII